MAHTLLHLLSISQYTLRTVDRGHDVHFQLSVAGKQHEPLKFVLSFEPVPAEALCHATDMMVRFEAFFVPWIGRFMRNEVAIDLHAITRFGEQLREVFRQDDLAGWTLKDLSLNGGPLNAAYIWDLVFFVKRLAAMKATEPTDSKALEAA